MKRALNLSLPKTAVIALLVLLSTNCSKKVDDPNGSTPGDVPGDGDGDSMGDGDGAGDGDGKPAGDGDGDDGTGGSASLGSGGGPTIVLGLGGATNDDTPIGQVDILFVIDNSVSMADKQEMLRVAVPEMVRQLVDPPCLDDTGREVEKMNGDCPEGAATEYAPLEDIHVGVISSSLGGHGARQCPRTESGWNNDDQARLMATMRTGTPGNEQGFLTWNGGGSSVAEQFVADFSAQIDAVGETGCGYEAPLEAWYRFLVDPQPPERIVLDQQNRSMMEENEMGEPIIDQVVLEQRAAFLRPESLVSIVVLTDENDCSIMDGGAYYKNASFGYLISEATFDLPIATAVCETNPNDECCFSCLQKGSPPEGCEEAASICDGDETVLTGEEDRANVRCFEGKRRFGVDLLYPTDRYVSALRDREIVDARSGKVVQNPLLTGVGPNEGTLRPNGRVYITGIVGVPWQDLVTDESLENPEVFEYLPPRALRQEFEYDGELIDRWDVMLGSPGIALSAQICQDNPNFEGCGQAPILPRDPFMIESISPRTAGEENPISGDQIVDAASTNPLANAINGHEVNHDLVDPKHTDGLLARDDLQYACIFPLATPKLNCSPEELNCDCGDEPSRNRPLCQPPEGGAASKSQYFAKAYPGTRILQVLRDYGDNAIVGSICPKIPELGYTPTIKTIIKRMKDRFPVVR